MKIVLTVCAVVIALAIVVAVFNATGGSDNKSDACRVAEVRWEFARNGDPKIYASLNVQRLCGYTP